MIFMNFMKSSFHAYPHRFAGFNNTSIFCLVFSNCATSLPVLMKLKSTRRCGWHRNFPCSTRLFPYTMNSSSSGSMKKKPRNLLALSSFGSRLPTSASLCVSMHQTYVSTYPGIHCPVLRSSLRLFVFLSISPWP